jgi:hypothetical protein
MSERQPVQSGTLGSGLDTEHMAATGEMREPADPLPMDAAGNVQRPLANPATRRNPGRPRKDGSPAQPRPPEPEVPAAEKTTDRALNAMREVVAFDRASEAVLHEFRLHPQSMAREIVRLRAALLRAVQYDNKCDGTGSACREPERCGCHLEAATWMEADDAR